MSGFETTISVDLEAPGADRFASDLKKVTDGLKQQNLALRESSLALEKQIQQLKAMEEPDKKAIALLQQKRQAIRLNIQETEMQIAQNRLQIASMEKLEAAQEAAANAGKNLSLSFLKQTAAVVGLGAGLVGFVAGLNKAITGFGDFERTLNTIQAVSQATVGDMKAIKQASLDLGQSTVFSVQQVADTFEVLGKTGVSVNDSLAIMPSLLDLAAASGGDLAKSAEITMGVLKGFNLQASESAHVSDVLAQAANVSAGDVLDFGMALKQLAPVAVGANQSLEDLTSILAVLSNRMINGADAGTDLKAIFANLVKPEIQKELKAIGITIADNQGKTKAFSQIVDELRKKLSTMNQQAQNQVIYKIAGVENAKSLSALLNASQQEITEMIQKMKDADGQAKKTADTINQGLNSALEQFGGAAEAAGIKVGEKLAPALSAVLNLMTDLLTAFSNNQMFNSFVVGAGSAVTAVGTLTATLLALPPAMNAVRNASVALSTTLGISTGGLWWVLGGLALAGGAVGVAMEEQSRKTERLNQTTLELRGEIERSESALAAESVATVKLGKEYDQLAKKTSQSKEEKDRLADITEEITHKYGIEASCKWQVKSEPVCQRKSEPLKTSS